jgi:polysaccharide deacetylase 2 family uncharacterized protein YibQ
VAALAAAAFWLARHRPAPPPAGARPAPARSVARAPAPRRAPPPATVPPRAAATEVAAPTGAGPRARVALILDDFGRSTAESERALALGVPMTYAVLPFEPRSAEVARQLRAAGAEVLVHLPMEAVGAEDPGPRVIATGQSRSRVTRLTERAIEAVPGAAGLNNHMGSLATADARTMGAVLDVVARRGLFFVDSRTSAETGAFDWARERGIAAVRRDVFLDAEPEPAAVAEQFARLLELARAHGAAVAIGHPRPATLEVLAREIPRARAAGVEFVPVSYLLERSEANPE